MMKKIFFGVAIFVLSILFTNSVSAADIDVDYNAELNKVCKPSHCIVPIPTLVDPNEKIIKIDENFYLTGLTWNNTNIDIYVNDEYQGVATVVDDDDSDIANFYYLIENNSLLEGQHEWKVIAWTKSMRKRSYVSVENKFTIEAYFLAPKLDKITNDIDGNNWLIGSAENNSIVSIYVDNVYQGQVQTNGDFNYNLGPLSPGLHTFYAIAQEIISDRTSKRSNILSEQVAETQIMTEDLVEDFDQSEEKIIIDPVVEPIEEDVDQVDESEEGTEDLDGNISSISEGKDLEGDIIIQIEKEEGSVNVTETDDYDVEVDVISYEESQDQLVVDNQKSELSELNEQKDNTEEQITAIEGLQPATPNNNDEELIMEELNVVNKQERNRKVGLWLLIVLIVIVVFSTILSRKKGTSKLKELEKKDDDSESHQGDLFNKE